MLKRMNLEQPKAPPRFCIVCARGLGDALLSMILAHNLALYGISVTIFSSILCELRDWFPDCQISPFPSAKSFFSTFESYHSVIAADHSIVNESHHFGNRLILLKESTFNKKMTMADNLRLACQERLLLPISHKENGIKPPENLKFRAFPKRVAIHPTSSDEKKNWPAKKFLLLADKLSHKGFSPFFCVSPSERREWLSLVSSKELLPLFPSIADLASFIYESGYVIGNDSGTGHLASALHIPTLAIFSRKSYSKLWRPGWGPSMVVTPSNFVIGAPLKIKFWKNLLSVSKVLKCFSKLSKENGVNI